MKLTIEDRIQFPQLYPKEGNLIDITIIKGIDDKVKISSKEIEDYDIKITNTPNGGVSFTWDKTIPEFEIEFTKIELTILKRQIEKLDNDKKITLNLLTLIEKIKEIKDE